MKLYVTLITRTRDNRTAVMPCVFVDSFASEAEAIATAVRNAQLKYPSSEGWMTADDVEAVPVHDAAVRAAFAALPPTASSPPPPPAPEGGRA